jgi:hypothetical protein
MLAAGGLKTKGRGFRDAQNERVDRQNGQYESLRSGGAGPGPAKCKSQSFIACPLYSLGAGCLILLRLARLLVSECLVLKRTYLNPAYQAPNANLRSRSFFMQTAYCLHLCPLAVLLTS